jgi:hypothetical protein
MLSLFEYSNSPVTIVHASGLSIGRMVQYHVSPQEQFRFSYILIRMTPAPRPDNFIKLNYSKDVFHFPS